MLSKKLFIGVVAAILFVGGAGYIIYNGRPVMKQSVTTAPSPSPTPTSVPSPTPSPTPSETGSPSSSATGAYSMAEVQTHNTKTDCWSAINGAVYDLTTWISRHPGGVAPIIGLCGTDGTSAFMNQHGNRGRPASMLVLLKIGTLK